MDDGLRGLFLTNTLTRRKEPFRPLDWRDGDLPEAERRVRMYVCGPTVYDFAHIGNARPVIVFDTLFRLLRRLYGEDRVVYARNITDVDDKINARAARDVPDLPLNEAIARVTEATAEQFHRDVAALGNLPPTVEPRATAFVTPRDDGRPDMVSMIETLIAKGHAYEAGGEVLFAVESMPGYGVLSHRRLDEQQAGARVAVDAHKRHPADFVLWKLSAGNEPGWDSPWGRGRPGWHIECSVMSAAHLGETFDIHGGGLDLIFPHHENEIAQSCCAHGTQRMAEVWMHNGFLRVEGRKMSKSEGNFFTIHDVLKTDRLGGRDWPGEAVRLMMLRTPYREPLDFTVAKLEDAVRTLNRWERAVRDVEPTEPTPAFVEALCDDLNLNRAFGEMHRLLGDDPAALRACADLIGLQIVRESESGPPVDPDEGVADRRHGVGKIRAPDAVPSLERRSELDTAFVNARIAERLAFLKGRDFASADRIRDELAAIGVHLMDGKDPATGERTTTWETRR